MSRPRAAIVVTGSELLTGTISDANGPWLARRLSDLGFEVAHLFVVGDRPADLTVALEYVSGCALIVTSGGLGPTADDLTAELVARFAGAEMVLDEPMRARIAERVTLWARRNKLGDAIDMMKWFKKSAKIRNGAPTSEAVITPDGDFIVGKFIDRDRPMHALLAREAN